EGRCAQTSLLRDISSRSFRLFPSRLYPFLYIVPSVRNFSAQTVEGRRQSAFPPSVERLRRDMTQLGYLFRHEPFMSVNGSLRVDILILRLSGQASAVE